MIIMEKLEVALLGVPLVNWRGTRVIFPFAKLEGLFYYLLIKRQATRDELAALLWSGMDDDLAKKNLRNAVYLLKKLFTDEFIQTPSRTLVAVNREFAVDFDMDKFYTGKKVLNNGETVVTGSNEIEYCKEITNLYRGEFLEGFAMKDAGFFEEWLAGQRERIKELYARCLKKMIITLLNRKQISEAEQYLIHLIRVDEYNESAYRTLMKIYEKEGEFNRAVEVYSRLKNKLAGELAIKPDGATTKLYDRIQHRKEGYPLLAGKQHSCTDVFFGRKKQLSSIRNSIQAFLTGNKSGMTIVYGEQGVGKTTLVRHLFRAESFFNTVFLDGQCYQVEENYPFKPWNGILYKIAYLPEIQNVKLPVLWRHVISCVFPAVADSAIFSTSEPVTNPDILNCNMAEEVIIGVLHKVAGTKKIIMLLEDIQWIDNNSLLLVKQLLLNYADKFFVIATCRNENEYLKKLNTGLAELEKNRLLARVPVERFTSREVEDLSALMLPHDRITPQLLRTLYQHTEGNALFLTEYFKLIQNGQDIDQISPRIQSILQDRLTSVSEKGQKILRISSVFFAEINIMQVSHLCGLNELELVEMLEELQEKNLLVEALDQKSGLPVYNFTHVIIRDFIYSQLSLSRRKVLHDKIGMMIENGLKQDFRDRTLYSALLYHYSHAGNKFKVLEYTIKLAEGYSYINHELFPQMSDNYFDDGTILFVDQNLAAKYLQDIKCIIAAIKSTEGNSDRLSRLEAAYLDMLGRYYIWQDKHREGIRTIHRMIDLATEMGEHEYVIKGYQQIVYYGIRNSKVSIIENFANKIYHTAQKYNLKERMATGLRFLGVACSLKRENVLAEKYYRRSISLFKRMKDGDTNYTLSIAAAFNYIGDLRRLNRNFSEAIAYYEQALALCREKNIFKGLALFYTNAGHAAFEMGEYEKARHYLLEAENVYDWLGIRWGYATLHSILALMAVQDGRCEEALERLKKADEFLSGIKDILQKGTVLRAKAEIRYRMENDGRIKEVFKEYLTLPIEEYCCQGRKVLAALEDYYEIDILNNISRRLLNSD